MLKIDYIVNSFFNSITWLLLITESNQVWLIDCGDSIPIINYINKNNLTLRGVFLTHTHFDHIYGLNELFEKFPDLIVYTSEYGKKSLFSDKMNLSCYHEKPFIFKGNNVKVLRDKDKIELSGKITLNIVETPGHCPSCLTYYSDTCIFTGDSYIPGLKVVTKLPHGNKEDAISSIKIILDLVTNRKVYSGHI